MGRNRVLGSPFLVVMLIVATALAACSWDKPIPTASQPGYPCGVIGVVCEDASDAGLKATGMCCDQGQVCGGAFPNVGCPAGECCDENYGVNTSRGPRRSVGHQRPATP
jgi:hypothetical protein